MAKPDYRGEKCLCEISCVSDSGSYVTSSCINVNTANVCDSSNCSIGPGCGNRFLPRYPLDIIQTRAGFGIVSDNNIPKGSFIIEYVGEILIAEDATSREDRRYQAEFRSKTKSSGGTKVYVDALSCGNKSRFINHSCQANCAMYEFNWSNSRRLGIFSVQEIPALQELTFTYRRSYRELFDCKCVAHQH
ncbi:hypothetical protein PHMEG_00018658 [Phytophthora megakarya]|uniref:SET domain-containing protein n=1 Tax=Phytophthora megakarya TaxID=4795 RepID=A0A225VTI0_9STRA|nr:hypothetical protein PHMEG_00018658 [Phytophthora megakarya]